MIESLCGEALNHSQAEVVRHDAAQALLVIAGAGTGKTGTLAARVAAFVQAGADPRRVLLLSYSRRAAAALSHRAGLVLRQTLRLPGAAQDALLPWAGTFHSAAARLVRHHAAQLGLQPGFTVLDRGDAEELMGQQRARLGLHRHARRFPLAATCLNLWSQSVNRATPLRALVESEHPWCEPWLDELQRLFAAYADEKRRQQLLDFDDLLLAWQLMLEEPRLAAALRGRFDHLLVDEIQDTNALQQTILQGMAPQGRGLVMVGDDAQSIYAFRGAHLRGMLDMPARFDPPAAVLKLEQNYRSTQAILDAANAVIAQAREGYPKSLRTDRRGGSKPLLVAVLDEAAEAAWVADEVLRQREQGLMLRRQAVLFRNSSHSATLEIELARRDIPFVKYGGLRFLEAAHIKDLLSLLRWVQNPRAEFAALRCVRLLPGIGPAVAARLVAAVATADEPAAAMAAFTPPPRAVDEWRSLAATWLQLRESPWPQAIRLAIDWYRPHLQRLHDDAKVRGRDLEQLQAIAATQPSRERFLAELSLDPPQATSDEARDPHRDEDYLILSTIHAAKGQEWHAVNVLRVVDGCMPADLATGTAAEIEEERRLLYVAMTRAKDQLNLLVPQRFHITQQRHLGDRHLYASLSRFITPAMLPLFDPCTAGSSMPDDETVEPVAIDLAARLRERLRGSEDWSG